jgi:phosphatidylethanolamine/phosphatidyl-N-methylethanolamine N-methyltransferase
LLEPIRSSHEVPPTVDAESVRKAYRRHALLYDVYCGALLEPGRRQTIARMGCRPGERVLEVGVGTGLSLPMYPAGVRVAGIDLSGAMLSQAGERRREDARLGLVDLCQMDAERMGFADESFDKVVAMYVASTVPHPPRLVAEMRRVCKPGGGLYVLNHFHSANLVAGRIESLFAPLSRLIGFRPDFSLDRFLDETGLEVADVSPAGRFGYWTLLEARKGARPAAREPETVDATQGLAGRCGIPDTDTAAQ